MMHTLIGKILAYINYYKNLTHPMRDYLSPQDYAFICGVEDKWWYI